MKQFFIKNNISFFRKVSSHSVLPTVLWAGSKGPLPLAPSLFILPLIFLLVLFSSCAPQKTTPIPSTSPILQTSSPTPADSPVTSPHARKVAPYRYGEDPAIREAKHKYIPREVWDVAGSPDLAKERVYLNEAINKDPSNYEPVYFLGFNYLEARMLNESAEAFEKVLKLKPDHPLALENLALAYFQNRQFQKAFAVTERGLKLYPGNPRLIYLQGQCFLSDGNDPEKAEKLYTDALNNGIKSPHIYTGLAEVFIEQGSDKKAEAFKLLQKCVDEYPGYPNASTLLAELCMERGDSAKAISLLRQVMETTPAFTDARRLLGEIYIETADYKSAEDILKMALNQRPDNINEIKNGLGEAYLNMGQVEKARETLGQVINYKGEDPDYNENQAQAYLQLALADLIEGKTASAQENIKKAEKGKYDPSILALVQSRLFTQQGKYDKASNLMKKLLEEDGEENSLPPYKIYLEMANIEAVKGNKPKAADLLKTAAEKAAGYQKSTLRTLISRNEKLKSIK